MLENKSDTAVASELPRKKMALVSFKYVDTHPRLNRLVSAFDEAGYDVTVVGLSANPKITKISKSVKFITFPMRNTVRAKFTKSFTFPTRLLMGSIGAVILIYCKIRKI